MRSSLTRLLSQFGFGVSNDLLAAIIVLVGFAGTLTALALAGAL